MYTQEVFEGNQLREGNVYQTNEAFFGLPGVSISENPERNHIHHVIPIDEKLLSRHILLLGGIGSGKTNTMNWIINSVRENMKNDDVAVIFDTKGDFYKDFYRPGDVVISNDRTAVGPDGKPDFWNIFKEVMIDDRVEENILEIARTLFADKIEGSSQPFFPNAAKDLFAASMLELVRNPAAAELRNNGFMRKFFNQFTAQRMLNILSKYDDLKAMSSYIADPGSGQTLGVVAELQQLVREIFVGNFARDGGISIRELIKRKERKVIFVEYDLSLGETLSPIYRLIIDLAIKQALCRSGDERGNVYFFLDEFRLLPHLKHVDNGVNFGRSLGAKFIVGIQNVDQLYAAYGQNVAASLLSGFGTNFSFRVNDKNSRDYIRGLYGSNFKRQTFSSAMGNKGVVEQMREGSVIEDHDVTERGIGQAIVGIMNCEPFLFQFDEYIHK